MAAAACGMEAARGQGLGQGLGGGGAGTAALVVPKSPRPHLWRIGRGRVKALLSFR